MKKKIINVIALCSCLMAYGQGDAYFQTNFNNGIPQDFKLVDNDETPINSGVYRNISLSGSWVASEIDTKSNFAAFSLSRCNYKLPSENWMITPAIQLNSENACLRWEAKSVHYDFRESYKVMISITDNDLKSFKEICTIDRESYAWKTHTISLGDYAGKKVYIAFVCISDNQFLLAIDNLFIGELSEVSFETTDESKRFSGDTGTAPVKGKIRNTGKAVDLKKINCRTEQETYSQQFDDMHLLPDEEVAFEFDIPVSLNEISSYLLEAELSDGNVYALCEDSIICSYYPRTLLVEKATGTWCNSCPNGTLVSNRLKERFADEGIVIEAHISDPLQCAPYSVGITRWLQSYPSFIYNRESSSVQTSMWEDAMFKKALRTPTTAKVDTEIERLNVNGNILDIHTQTEFALDYENASGLYKLGYAVFEKEVYGGIQSNGTTLLNSCEYYYLPYNIPSEVCLFHNVVREGTTAFNGVENSLPALIEAGMKYDFTYSLTLPDKLVRSDNLFVVTFVINTLTGAVLNAARTDIPLAPTGMDHLASDGRGETTVFRMGDASYEIHFKEPDVPYTIELIDLSGRVINTKRATAGTQAVTVNYPNCKGCYFLRISQLNDRVIKKIMLY